ncbi:hypothetical protein EYF80_047769 [Liparis tanakae]|uniref:Uncharacterized protein n=1 Tax=Liparis tanakae TaxID=230148 RepID=A0A4Z2FP07_9TELE|nr:hypothetical protein EYF80_047769 [Liparis tanakae]
MNSSLRLKWEGPRRGPRAVFIIYVFRKTPSGPTSTLKPVNRTAAGFTGQGIAACVCRRSWRPQVKPLLGVGRDPSVQLFFDVRLSPDKERYR